MFENDLKKIIKNHASEGMIEEANLAIPFNQTLLYFNKFTLKLKKIRNTSIDFDYYNAQILKLVKQNPNLYKEIREYNLVFRFLKKLKIKNGYIKKSETPDFVLDKDEKRYGIEVTRIYAGNDWIAEKLHNDILAYRLKDKNLYKYIHDKKFEGKIKTYQTKKGIVVKAVKEKVFRIEEMVQIKNKIFEKIRKQIDDYAKYDYNFIFAEIVFTDYEVFNSIEVLNKEIQYFISHLDILFGEAEFHLILKIGNMWNDFDLKKGTYQML